MKKVSDDAKPYTRDGLATDAAEQIAAFFSRRTTRKAREVVLARLYETARAGLEDRQRRERHAYVMAMAILQSELYHAADDELRAAIRAATNAYHQTVSESSGRGASATNDGGETYG